MVTNNDVTNNLITVTHQQYKEGIEHLHTNIVDATIERYKFNKVLIEKPPSVNANRNSFPRMLNKHDDHY